MSDQNHQVVQHHRRGGVLELVIDCPPVNALGAALRQGLANGIAVAEADPDIGAVIIRAAGRTFPVGADIREFDQPPVLPLLPELCDMIEGCSKPVVAAIHGAALGGGLELALAAHSRVALAEARIGLPEVGLGILPGAGGTQRLPRLIGAEQALRLMLTGQPIGAAEGLALGVLDRVVEADLADEALSMAEDLMGRLPVQTRARREGMRDAVTYQVAVTAARKAQAGSRLPGPPKIVDCVEAALLLPFEAGLAFERTAFEDLVGTPEAAGLRHAFFAERAAARMPEAKAEPRAIDHVGIVGAAGGELAFALLRAGYRITLVEAAKTALVSALELVAAEMEQAVQLGKISVAERDADWARLVPAVSVEALAKADLVLVADTETVVAVAEATRPGVVLALTRRGAGVAAARAADTLGLRMDPKGSSRLAEVIVGPTTDVRAVATLLALLRRMGRVALRAKAPGGIGARVIAAGRAVAGQMAAEHHQPVAQALHRFGLTGLLGEAQADDTGGPQRSADEIVARVMTAMANEGAKLVGQGVAQRPSDVDLALLLAHGFPRWEGGPMHWADQRGLIVLRRDLRNWAEDAPEFWEVAPLIDELIAKGRRFGDLNG